MVERNCTLPFCFYCLTDDIDDLPEYVIGIQLDPNLDLESYWWKMCLFQLNWNKPTMYFDLDIIIQNDFDHLFKQITKNKILTIRPDDAGIDRSQEKFIKHIAIINSSILGLVPCNHLQLFDDFMLNVDYNILEYVGMDRYLSNFIDHFNFIKFKEYYYRWKDDMTPSKYCTDKVIKGVPYNLAHDPTKTFCIISQAEPEMYQGLEKYFL